MNYDETAKHREKQAEMAAKLKEDSSAARTKEIIKELKQAIPVTQIAKKHGMHTSSIYYIKKRMDKTPKAKPRAQPAKAPKAKAKPYTAVVVEDRKDPRVKLAQDLTTLIGTILHGK